MRKKGERSEEEWERKSRRGEKRGMGETGRRLVPIGRNYSIPYYLHVDNFAMSCIVDQVHKHAYPREYNAMHTVYERCESDVCTYTRVPSDDTFKFQHDF